ncbi:hypothetical protein AX17_000324 [Amanita inopinata Kibby_2008]|nr:hypothetical protein AX17_000324 [Amanita inopinata Kibby_2008]
MAASLSGLSASVTRILYLTGFPKELKTKDIQQAFVEYESMNGGFKIKWRDDTSLMIVFQDSAVAKRAYLHTLAFPPAIFTSISTGTSATIRPYDGPEAQTIIQTVNTRSQHNPTHSRSHTARAASISVFPSSRSVSGSSIIHSSSSYRNNHSSNGQQQHHLSIPEHQPSSSSMREPSPVLPSIPSHPTLNALISSSLGEVVTSSQSSTPHDPAILSTSLQSTDLAGSIGGPRIGDPGKRMLGAALGVRHPSLGPRMLNGNSSSPSQGSSVDHTMRDVQRSMGGLVVAE